MKSNHSSASAKSSSTKNAIHPLSSSSKPRKLVTKRQPSSHPSNALSTKYIIPVFTPTRHFSSTPHFNSQEHPRKPPQLPPTPSDPDFLSPTSPSHHSTSSSDPPLQPPQPLLFNFPNKLVTAPRARFSSYTAPELPQNTPHSFQSFQSQQHFLNYCQAIEIQQKTLTPDQLLHHTLTLLKPSPSLPTTTTTEKSGQSQPSYDATRPLDFIGHLAAIHDDTIAGKYLKKLNSSPLFRTGLTNISSARHAAIVRSIYDILASKREQERNLKRRNGSNSPQTGNTQSTHQENLQEFDSEENSTESSKSPSKLPPIDPPSTPTKHTTTPHISSNDQFREVINVGSFDQLLRLKDTHDPTLSNTTSDQIQTPSRFKHSTLPPMAGNLKPDSQGKWTDHFDLLKQLTFFLPPHTHHALDSHSQTFYHTNRIHQPQILANYTDFYPLNSLLSQLLYSSSNHNFPYSRKMKNSIIRKTALYHSALYSLDPWILRLLPLRDRIALSIAKLNPGILAGLYKAYNFSQFSEPEICTFYNISHAQNIYAQIVARYLGLPCKSVNINNEAKTSTLLVFPTEYRGRHSPTLRLSTDSKQLIKTFITANQSIIDNLTTTHTVKMQHAALQHYSKSPSHFNIHNPEHLKHRVAFSETVWREFIKITTSHYVKMKYFQAMANGQALLENELVYEKLIDNLGGKQGGDNLLSGQPVENLFTMQSSTDLARQGILGINSDDNRDSNSIRNDGDHDALQRNPDQSVEEENSLNTKNLKNVLNSRTSDAGTHTQSPHHALHVSYPDTATTSHAESLHSTQLISSQEPTGNSHFKLYHPDHHDFPEYPFAEMNPIRSADLPVMRFKNAFIDAMHNNQVVLVVGGTGCGKSTQLPQFILDHMNALGQMEDCNVLVTQPRRFAATSLADRVAEEQGHSLSAAQERLRLKDAARKKAKDQAASLQSLLPHGSKDQPDPIHGHLTRDDPALDQKISIPVGYRISMDNVANETTNLTFSTAGFVLKQVTSTIISGTLTPARLTKIIQKLTLKKYHYVEFLKKKKLDQLHHKRNPNQPNSVDSLPESPIFTPMNPHDIDFDEMESDEDFLSQHHVDIEDDNFHPDDHLAEFLLGAAQNVREKHLEHLRRRIHSTIMSKHSRLGNVALGAKSDSEPAHIPEDLTLTPEELELSQPELEAFWTSGKSLHQKALINLLQKYSHIVIDEVHESCWSTNLLITLIKDVLPSLPHLRFILMSATANTHELLSFLNCKALLQIESATYPVDTYGLYDVLQMTNPEPIKPLLQHNLFLNFIANQRALARKQVLISDKFAEIVQTSQFKRAQDDSRFLSDIPTLPHPKDLLKGRSMDSVKDFIHENMTDLHGKKFRDLAHLDTEIGNQRETRESGQQMTLRSSLKEFSKPEQADDFFTCLTQPMATSGQAMVLCDDDSTPEKRNLAQLRKAMCLYDASSKVESQSSSKYFVPLDKYNLDDRAQRDYLLQLLFYTPSTLTRASTYRNQNAPALIGKLIKYIIENSTQDTLLEKYGSRFHTKFTKKGDSASPTQDNAVLQNSVKQQQQQQHKHEKHDEGETDTSNSHNSPDPSASNNTSISSRCVEFDTKYSPTFNHLLPFDSAIGLGSVRHPDVTPEDYQYAQQLYSQLVNNPAFDNGYRPAALPPTPLRSQEPLPDGSILVFCSALNIMISVQQALDQLKMSNLEVILLHAQFRDSLVAVRKPVAPGTRRVILATSVAETSVTFPDVTHVIDMGYSKSLIYNSVSKISNFSLEDAVKSSVNQRRGRVGRVRPGICYRLFSKQQYEEMHPHPRPETLTISPIEVVFSMASLLDNSIKYSQRKIRKRQNKAQFGDHLPLRPPSTSQHLGPHTEHNHSQNNHIISSQFDLNHKNQHQMHKFGTILTTLSNTPSDSTTSNATATLEATFTISPQHPSNPSNLTPTTTTTTSLLPLTPHNTVLAPSPRIATKAQTSTLSRYIFALSSRLLHPIPQHSVTNALSILSDAGLFTSQGTLSPLGQLTFLFPVSITGARILISSLIAGCLEHGLTMAALTNYASGLVLAQEDERLMRLGLERLNAAINGFPSLLFGYAHMYNLWSASPSPKQFALTHSLSHDTLMDVKHLRFKLLQILKRENTNLGLRADPFHLSPHRESLTYDIRKEKVQDLSSLTQQDRVKFHTLLQSPYYVDLAQAFDAVFNIKTDPHRDTLQQVQKNVWNNHSIYSPRHISEESVAFSPTAHLFEYTQQHSAEEDVKLPHSHVQKPHHHHDKKHPIIRMNRHSTKPKASSLVSSPPQPLSDVSEPIVDVAEEYNPEVETQTLRFFNEFNEKITSFPNFDSPTQINAANTITNLLSQLDLAITAVNGGLQFDRGQFNKMAMDLTTDHNNDLTFDLTEQSFKTHKRASKDAMKVDQSQTDSSSTTSERTDSSETSKSAVPNVNPLFSTVDKFISSQTKLFSEPNEAAFQQSTSSFKTAAISSNRPPALRNSNPPTLNPSTLHILSTDPLPAGPTSAGKPLPPSPFALITQQSTPDQLSSTSMATNLSNLADGLQRLNATGPTLFTFDQFKPFIKHYSKQLFQHVETLEDILNPPMNPFSDLQPTDPFHKQHRDTFQSIILLVKSSPFYKDYLDAKADEAARGADPNSNPTEHSSRAHLQHIEIPQQFAPDNIVSIPASYYHSTPTSHHDKRMEFLPLTAHSSDFKYKNQANARDTDGTITQDFERGISELLRNPTLPLPHLNISAALPTFVHNYLSAAFIPDVGFREGLETNGSPAFFAPELGNSYITPRKGYTELETSLSPVTTFADALASERNGAVYVRQATNVHPLMLLFARQTADGFGHQMRSQHILKQQRRKWLIAQQTQINSMLAERAKYLSAQKLYLPDGDDFETTFAQHQVHLNTPDWIVSQGCRTSNGNRMDSMNVVDMTDLTTSELPEPGNDSKSAPNPAQPDTTKSLKTPHDDNTLSHDEHHRYKAYLDRVARFVDQTQLSEDSDRLAHSTLHHHLFSDRELEDFIQLQVKQHTQDFARFSSHSHQALGFGGPDDIVSHILWDLGLNTEHERTQHLKEHGYKPYFDVEWENEIKSGLLQQAIANTQQDNGNQQQHNGQRTVHDLHSPSQPRKPFSFTFLTDATTPQADFAALRPEYHALKRQIDEKFDALSTAEKIQKYGRHNSNQTMSGFTGLQSNFPVLDEVISVIHSSLQAHNLLEVTSPSLHHTQLVVPQGTTITFPQTSGSVPVQYSYVTLLSPLHQAYHIAQDMINEPNFDFASIATQANAIEGLRHGRGGVVNTPQHPLAYIDDLNIHHVSGPGFINANQDRNASVGMRFITAFTDLINDHVDYQATNNPEWAFGALLSDEHVIASSLPDRYVAKDKFPEARLSNQFLLAHDMRNDFDHLLELEQGPVQRSVYGKPIRLQNNKEEDVNVPNSAILAGSIILPPYSSVDPQNPLFKANSVNSHHITFTEPSSIQNHTIIGSDPIHLTAPGSDVSKKVFTPHHNVIAQLLPQHSQFGLTVQQHLNTPILANTRVRAFAQEQSLAKYQFTELDRAHFSNDVVWNSINSGTPATTHISPDGLNALPTAINFIDLLPLSTVERLRTLHVVPGLTDLGTDPNAQDQQALFSAGNLPRVIKQAPAGLLSISEMGANTEHELFRPQQQPTPFPSVAQQLQYAVAKHTALQLKDMRVDQDNLPPDSSQTPQSSLSDPNFPPHASPPFKTCHQAIDGIRLQTSVAHLLDHNLSTSLNSLVSTPELHATPLFRQYSSDHIKHHTAADALVRLTSTLEQSSTTYPAEESYIERQSPFNTTFVSSAAEIHVQNQSASSLLLQMQYNDLLRNAHIQSLPTLQTFYQQFFWHDQGLAARKRRFAFPDHHYIAQPQAAPHQISQGNVFSANRSGDTSHATPSEADSFDLNHYQSQRFHPNSSSSSPSSSYPPQRTSQSAHSAQSTSHIPEIYSINRPNIFNFIKFNSFQTKKHAPPPTATPLFEESTSKGYQSDCDSAAMSVDPHDSAHLASTSSPPHPTTTTTKLPPQYPPTIHSNPLATTQPTAHAKFILPDQYTLPYSPQQINTKVSLAARSNKLPQLYRYNNLRSQLLQQFAKRTFDSFSFKQQFLNHTLYTSPLLYSPFRAHTQLNLITPLPHSTMTSNNMLQSNDFNNLSAFLTSTRSLSKFHNKYRTQMYLNHHVHHTHSTTLPRPQSIVSVPALSHQDILADLNDTDSPIRHTPLPRASKFDLPEWERTQVFNKTTFPPIVTHVAPGTSHQSQYFPPSPDDVPANYIPIVSATERYTTKPTTDHDPHTLPTDKTTLSQLHWSNARIKIGQNSLFRFHSHHSIMLYFENERLRNALNSLMYHTPMGNEIDLNKSLISLSGAIGMYVDNDIYHHLTQLQFFLQALEDVELDYLTAQKPYSQTPLQRMCRNDMLDHEAHLSRFSHLSRSNDDRSTRSPHGATMVSSRYSVAGYHRNLLTRQETLRRSKHLLILHKTHQFMNELFAIQPIPDLTTLARAENTIPYDDVLQQTTLTPGTPLKLQPSISAQFQQYNQYFPHRTESSDNSLYTTTRYATIPQHNDDIPSPTPPNYHRINPLSPQLVEFQIESQHQSNDIEINADNAAAILEDVLKDQALPPSLSNRLISKMGKSFYSSINDYNIAQYNRSQFTLDDITGLQQHSTTPISLDEHAIIQQLHNLNTVLSPKYRQALIVDTPGFAKTAASEETVIFDDMPQHEASETVTTADHAPQPEVEFALTETQINRTTPTEPDFDLDVNPTNIESQF